MIKTYIKLPVPIEAVQWKGSPVIDTQEERKFLLDKSQFGIDGEEVVLTVHTLEGDMKVHPGDYIVRGVDGEFYPVKKEIFEKTYVEAKEDEELVSARKDRLEELIEAAYDYSIFCAVYGTKACRLNDKKTSCSVCEYGYDKVRDDYEPPVNTVLKWLEGEENE